MSGNWHELREKLIAHHQSVEKVAESPWCPTNPVMAVKLQQGEVKLSERPIAFIDDDRRIIVGDCATVVLDAAGEFVKIMNAKLADMKSKDDKAKLTHEEAWAVKCCSALSADDEGTLNLDTRTFNGVMYAMLVMKVNVITTDGVTV